MFFQQQRPSRAPRFCPLIEPLEDRNLLSFLPPVDYEVGKTPRSVTVADFRGDGRLDLAVPNIDSNSVSILLGNGDGTFQAAVTYLVGMQPHFVAAEDFDGDGRVDLLVTNAESGTFSLLRGNGDGTFQPAISSLAAGDWPHRLVVADFDGDGNLDFAVENTFSNDMSIFLGNGDGTFRHVANYDVGLNPVGIAMGDFNGDGNMDLALPNYRFLSKGGGGGNVRIFLGNGDGTFRDAGSYDTGADAWSVAVGDFNGDGRLDLAVTNSDRGVAVLLGNGDGTFGPPTYYPAGSYAFDVTATDIDGDGRIDLVTANANSSDVSVLRGNGDGTFRPPENYGIPHFPWFVTAADLNGDGLPDLVLADPDSGITVLLNAADWSASAHEAPLVSAQLGLSPRDISQETRLDAAEVDALFSGHQQEPVRTASRAVGGVETKLSSLSARATIIPNLGLYPVPDSSEVYYVQTFAS